MYVYVCICMYMYVCVCISKEKMYIEGKYPSPPVYVCICMYMYVYVCICMYMYVYVCISKEKTHNSRIVLGRISRQYLGMYMVGSSKTPEKEAQRNQNHH